jgi:uncharacterized coiled-coil DUF342 family protein
MNQEVVKQLNHLKVEKAEWESALAQAKLNEEYADEKENIEKEIATIDNEIKKLAGQLNKPVEIGNAE